VDKLTNAEWLEELKKGPEESVLDEEDIDYDFGLEVIDAENEDFMAGLDENMVQLKDPVTGQLTIVDKISGQKTKLLSQNSISNNKSNSIGNLKSKITRLLTKDLNNDSKDVGMDMNFLNELKDILSD